MDTSASLVSNKSALNVQNNHVFFFDECRLSTAAAKWSSLLFRCCAVKPQLCIIQTHTGERKRIFVLASNVSGRKLAMCYNNSACQSPAGTYRGAPLEERAEVCLKGGWKHVVCCQITSQGQRSTISSQQYFPLLNRDPPSPTITTSGLHRKRKMHSDPFTYRPDSKEVRGLC